MCIRFFGQVIEVCNFSKTWYTEGRICDEQDLMSWNEDTIWCNESTFMYNAGFGVMRAGFSVMRAGFGVM